MTYYVGLTYLRARRRCGLSMQAAAGFGVAERARTRLRFGRDVAEA